MTATVTTAPATTTWKLDAAHSLAEFKVRHMMITNVQGQFTALSGTLTLDPDDVSRSRVEAAIEAASIHTREPQRDAHLKSADFFDVETFPQLTFRSTAVTPAGERALEVAGELTLHGVTRPVVFQVEGPTPPARDPWGGTRIGLTATTRIHRKDFGLTYNAALETGGVMVGDEVTITIEAEFVQA
jgi:polyisoprenoid-binding protein YceI